MKKCRLVNRYSVRYALSVTCINVMPSHSEFETTVLPSSSSYWLPLQTFQRSRKIENNNVFHSWRYSLSDMLLQREGCSSFKNEYENPKVAEKLLSPLNMAELPAATIDNITL